MSDEKKTSRVPKEFRILKAMKKVLTGIIKDTTVPAGHKHPLADNTIEDIRQCLMLISAREQELLHEAGEKSTMAPRYVDEEQDTTVVPISRIGKSKPRKQDS